MEQNDFLGKVSDTVLKWVKLASAWVVSFVKIRSFTLRLRKARKNLEAKNSTLGMEVYALYRRGEIEIRNSPVIMQQLKIVEEAESRVLELQARMDSVTDEYRSKKDAISAKRA